MKTAPSFLGLGGDARRLLVRRAQDRCALGAQGTRQGRLVELGIGGAVLGIGELVAHLVKSILQVSDLARDGLEMRVVTSWGSIPPLRSGVKFVRMISDDEERAEEGFGDLPLLQDYGVKSFKNGFAEPSEARVSHRRCA